MFKRFLIPAAIAGVLLVLAGCSTTGAKSGRIDYGSKAEVSKPLEVPPDLTLPSGGSGEMTIPLLSMQKEGGEQAAASSVLPRLSNVVVAGSASQRWLVVSESPDEIWPKLQSFWPSVGLVLERDEPKLGVMETAWAENRASIKGGFLKNMISKMLPNLYSATTRDKYRLRLERGENGGSELYVTHYGVEEVVTSKDTFGFEETAWQVRPSDPELANEILKRLMVYLGSAESSAEKLQVTQPASTSVTVIDEGGPALRINEEFERAWRRTGIALDRMGLVVEDRDRSNGLYYVTKVELLEKDEKGWLGGLFSGKEEKAASPNYRIKVAPFQEGSLITLLDGNGNRLTSENARTLLQRMGEQMQ